MAERGGRRPGALWVETHWSELERNYPNQWIAADDKGVVVHGATCEGVLRGVHEEGRNFAEVMITHIKVEAIQ